MSLNELFEALKALIIPFITRFEKLERRLNEIEESDAYTSGIVEELQGDQLDDRLSRVERKLGDESDLERLADRVGYIHEEARDYFCRVESLEADFESIGTNLEEVTAHVVNEQSCHIIRRLDDQEEDLKYILEDDRGIVARLGALETEFEMLDRAGMQSDLDHLEREMKALKASHQAQDKTIKALLKALEWEPPKD